MTFNPSKTGFDYVDYETENEALISVDNNVQQTIIYLSSVNNPKLRIKADGSSILRIKFNRKIIPVTFNDDQGSNILTTSVKYGGSVNAPEPPNKNGKVFKNWNKLSNNITYLLGSYEITAVYEDEIYNITYELDDGINSASNPTTYIYSSNRINFANPTKTGHDFLGWYTNLNAGVYSNQITFLQNSIGNITAYARWQVRTFSVTYDIGNNATLTGGTANQVVNFGNNSVEVTIVPNNGYSFVKWSDNSANPTRVENNVVNNIYISALVNVLTYTITYNLDDGINSLNNPNSFTVVTPNIALSNPTKNGFEFIGWFDNPEFNGDQITQIAQGSFGNINLYAKFNAFTNTIAYQNLSGATHTNPTGFATGQEVNLTNPTNRNGYTFTGWFDQLTGGSQVYTINTIGDSVVYARWSLISYTITYNNLKPTANAASTHSNPASFNIESSNISLADPTSQTGLTFVGWFDAATTGNQISLITTGTFGNIELFARWQDVENVNLTFDALGGSGISGYSLITYDINGNTITTPKTITVTNSISTIIEPAGAELEIAQANTITKNGYNFGGWFTNQNYQSQFLYTIDNPTYMAGYNTILYGKWNPINYTITYDLTSLNGATHTNPINYTIETNINSFSDPTVRTGYQFVGWFDTPTEGNQVTSLAVGTTGNKLLYARWSLNSYTLTLQNNEISPPTTNTYSIDFNQAINSGNNGSLPIPEKTGFRFVGWSNNGVIYSGTELMPAANLTLFAEFTDKVYVVNYQTSGGVNSPNNIGSFNETDLVNNPIILFNPEKTGFIAEGWFNAELNGNQITEINSSNLSTLAIPVAGEEGKFTITLYARYELLSYNITYELFGGANNIENPTTYTSSSSIITFKDATKEGHTFAGWFDGPNPNNSNQVYVLASGSTGDKTYYAKFTVNFYNLSTFKIATATVDEYKSGLNFNVMVDDDGKVFTWGQNNYGQLGNGNFENIPIPIDITSNFLGLTSGEKIIDVALGSHHTIALTNFGKVYTWGFNAYGQLGDGTTTNRNLPVNVTSRINLPSNQTVWKISAGFNNSWIIAKDPNVVLNPSVDQQTSIFGWGYNLYGQVGDGTYVNRLSPINISSYLYGTSSSGVLGSWGSGQNAVPSSNAGGSIIKITGGDGYSGLLSNKGRVLTWGRNDNKKKFLGNSSGASTVVLQYINGGAQVGNTQNVTILFNDIFIGAETTYGLARARAGTVQTPSVKENDLFVWGSNLSGQYGTSDTTTKGTPFYVGNIHLGTNEVIKFIDGKYFHTVMVILNTSTNVERTFILGNNVGGQIGNGSSGSTLVTTKYEITSSSNELNKISLNAGESITGSAVSFRHTSLFTSQGRVFSWGDNSFGQLGIAEFNSGLNVPIDMSAIDGGGFKISIASYNLEFASSIVIPIPQETNKSFIGWYLDPKHLVPFTDQTMPAQDLILYAKFE